MIIYGAGMAGLLAANMLRRYKPEVREAADSLPDNHGALLRFRTGAVAQATGQQFRKVTVHKAIKHEGALHTKCDLKMSNMYSLKVTGEAMGRSIMNLEPGVRYIAPDDFIATMAQSADIKYGNPFQDPSEKLGGPVISTIPMPVMMGIVGWNEAPEFKHLPIWSYRAKIISPKCDVYQTIYYTDPYSFHYRASITGDQLIVEFLEELALYQAREVANDVIQDFGFNNDWRSPVVFEGEVLKYQHYGKLLPIDDKIRRAFIMALSTEYGIYSVGRFATWRQILMDDVVNDVNVVERFISDRDQYSRNLHWR